MSDDQPTPQPLEQPADGIITVLNNDGTVTAYARATKEVVAALGKQGVQPKPAQDPATFMELNAAFADGQVINRRITGIDKYRSPRLTVPGNYYTRVQWSNEYYEQEPLVQALVDRDIDTAIKPVEFQLPEDDDKGIVAKKVLEQWGRTVNEGIDQHDGINEFNRSVALELTLSSLVVCIANWGPIEVDGAVYRVPKVISTLDPELLVPDIDLWTGKRVYYYKITAAFAKELKESRRADNAWRQMIPNLGRAIVDELPRSTSDRYRREAMIDQDFLTGPFIRLPSELIYVINFRARQKDRFPVPTLTSIFSAIAMKRKLQLADWAVADGMINMLMVWSFPAGTTAEVARSVVSTAASGGRVQSVSVPAQVKVELITPPDTLLNSVDKFWVPVSEILAHFDFPLNSRSRGAGDLDSGALDISANVARLSRYRYAVAALDNFWLRQIAHQNKWSFEPTVLMASIDLTNNDAFRTFIQSLWDRGILSTETTLDAAGTTIEREVARRKKEQVDGIEDVLEIRPTFSQTTGVPGDGRTPDAEGKPRGGAKPDRPSSSAQSETRS